MAAAVLALSYVLVLLVLVVYIRWVVKRYRKEREEKAAKRLGTIPPAPSPGLRPSSPVMPPVMPTAIPNVPAPEAAASSTVADAVRGVSLPCNLAPLIDLPVNSAALDRATFVTRGYPAEVVIDELGRALEAIGHDVRWVDARGMARRGDDELQIEVHRSPRDHGFLTAPEDGVVVDLWIASH